MNKAVIGLGFGDEGKGVTTEYLCSQDPKNTIVARFSGGHQAGHKVLKENIEHVFSSFGAGTLSGCPTYWTKNCTFDPAAFWNEYMLLLLKGVQPKFYIHPDCPVTTIFDVFVNRQSAEMKHGTTGTGFFRTKKRHFTDGVPFTAGTLFAADLEPVGKSLAQVANYYDLQELDVEPFLKATVDVRGELYKSIFLTDRMPDYKHKVFEGSQGLMLDEHIGHMPHCTPSDVTPKAIMDLGYKIDELFLVTRSYQTRHGNGPMTNEQYPVALTNNERETNKTNKYQGEFRTSVLDLDQLIRAKELGVDNVVPPGTKTNLVVTCTDQLSKFDLTFKGQLRSFSDPEKFARFIAHFLWINGDLYINDSPYSRLKHVK